VCPNSGLKETFEACFHHGRFGWVMASLDCILIVQGSNAGQRTSIWDTNESVSYRIMSSVIGVRSSGKIGQDDSGVKK
jgi:hypothetical protein